MKRYIRKITAVLLAALVAIGIVPPVEVFANPQERVVPGVVDRLPMPATAHSTYNFRLTWLWNEGMAHPTPTPGLIDGGHHQPEGFDIEWRNATSPESFNVTGGVRRAMNLPTSARTWDFNGSLSSGSIYSFRVVPWHYHRFPTNHNVTPPVTPPPQRIRPVPLTQHDEMLFLTDIRVNLGVGNQGGIMVTWDNPLFNNQQVFTGYQLSFRPEGAMNWTTDIPEITESTVGLQVGAGGREWSFEIAHPDLLQGQTYEVRVVPLTAPGTSIGTTVTIGGITHPINYSARSFIGDGFYLAPMLTLRPEGQELLLLTWGMPSPLLRVESIRIFSTTTPPGPNFDPVSDFATLIHSIVSPHGVTANHHIVPRPTEWPTWYIVELTGYSTGDPERPFRMLTNVAEFDPLFNAFEAYSPTIKEASHTGGIANLSLEITWLAFTRARFRVQDDLFPNRFIRQGEPWVVDNDVVYYVYITDDLANFDSPMQYVERLVARDHLAAREMDAVSVPGSALATDWFYTHTFDAYVNSAGERRPLSDNTIYYIRIYARRPISTEDHTSQNAYYSYYIPPLRPLDLAPPSVPVRIKELDGVRQIGQNYMYIQWSTEWFEVYDHENDRWYDVAGVHPDSDVRLFGRAAENLDPDDRVRLWEFHPATPLGDVRVAVAQVLGAGPEVVVRRMRVDPTHYEIHVVEYDIMAETTVVGADRDAFYAYMRIISDPSPGGWQNIGSGTPTAGNPNYRHYRVTLSNNVSGALLANTSYVVFFRPVNIVAGERYPAYVPSYTTGTTIAQRPPMDIDPTVPHLRVRRDETTDTSITLYWNGTLEFDYQLYFSELLIDYPSDPMGPSGGYPIPMELIRQGAIVEEDGILVFKVEGLFPYTLYHFWIRAVNEQGRTSVWSNPVSERTLDILPPDPINSVRLASNTSLQAYNTENSTELRHGDPADRLILEFQRIFADLNNPLPGPPQSGYDTTGGEATWLDSPSLVATYMTMFDDLIPNRRYYVRVQTILTVTRGDSPTGIIRAYSYRMQMADNEDFLDYIEIILPAIDPMPDTPGQLRRAVSVWAGPFFFWSGMTDDEYDGDINPDLFPLPDRDWELIYDRNTSTLTFRFRSNQIDASGARDHNVDQRFISRLVQQRVFTYRLDLSTYNNRPVQNAVVEMPYSILRAFDERRIALEVTQGNTRVTFTPGSLSTPEAIALAGVDANTMARLTIGGEMAAPLDAGGTYASAPRQINAQLITSTRTLNFENFAQPLQLAFALEGQALLMDQNVGLYTQTMWTQGWERLAASHSPVTGEMMFSTYRAGNFAAIAQAAPMQVMPMHPSRDAFLRVNATVAITDMPAFDPTEPVSGNVFNNMVAAVAMGRTSVAVYSHVDQADAQTLARAGIFVPANVVSREAAFASLVTLYERRIGRTIQPWDSAGPPDLGSASPANHLAIVKAADLGFFDGAARPTEALTMGDFMMILDIIILDAGLN